MTEQKIVLNTIVFKEQLDQGVLQESLVATVKELGAGYMEIRREFLQDVPTELAAIYEAAQQAGIGLLYSINDDFAVDGQINPLLEGYIQEALSVKAEVLKLNTGNADGLTVEVLKGIAPLLEVPLKVSVENNQALHNATVANIRHFLDLSGKAGLPIQFVFDTGNWYWVGDTVAEAMAQLKDATHYLHLKNCTGQNESAQITSLFEGQVDILSTVSAFEGIDFYAFEYPCSKEVLASDIARFRAGLGSN